MSIYDRLPRVCLLESLGPAVTADQAGVVIRAWREGWGLLGECPHGLQAPHEELRCGLIMWVLAGRGKGGRAWGQGALFTL